MRRSAVAIAVAARGHAAVAGNSSTPAIACFAICAHVALDHHRLGGSAVPRPDDVRRLRRPVRGRPQPWTSSSTCGSSMSRRLRCRSSSPIPLAAVDRRRDGGGHRAGRASGARPAAGRHDVRVRVRRAAVPLQARRCSATATRRSVTFRRGTLFGARSARSAHLLLPRASSCSRWCSSVVARLRRSGVGRTMIAVRDNPDAAAGYTVSPARTKLHRLRPRRAARRDRAVRCSAGLLQNDALQRVCTSSRGLAAAGRDGGDRRPRARSSGRSSARCGSSASRRSSRTTSSCRCSRRASGC